MANMLGRLGVVLGLDSAEFVMGIDRAGKKLEQFAESAEHYSKYAATAMLAMSYAAIKLADDIADVAQANDVAIDTVVKLRAALDASGGSADKAGVLLSSFTKFIDNAASGSFEAQKAFKSVGVSLKDIGSMTQEQLLTKVLSGLEKMDDVVTRNARAMDFFSKAAKGVDLTNLNKEIQNNSTLAEQQAKAIQEAAQAYDALAKIGNQFNVMLAAEIGPTLKTTIDYFDNLKDVFNLVGAAFKVVFQTVAIVGANVIFVVKGIALEIKAMYDFINNMVTKGLATAIAKNDEYVKRTIQSRKELDDFERRIMFGGQQGGSGRGMMGYESFANAPIARETTVGVDSKQQAALAKMAKEIKDRQEYHNKLIDENIKKNQELYEKEWNALTKKTEKLEDIQKIQDAAYMAISQQQSLRSAQLDYDREILLLNTKNKDLQTYELKYAQEILSIRTMFLQNEKNINENDQLNDVYKKQRIEEEIVLRDRSIAQAKEVLDIARQESEGSFQKGFGKGFDEFVRNMPNQLEFGRQTFNTLMSSMESALQNFVRTGKFSFKDFARSLIQDMIMIQARAQMLSMVKGLYSMFGGGTPSIDLSYGGGSAGAVGISGFADGGSPPVGRASLVGERGPELFVPRTAGTIIPNNQLASAMGGGQTVNYNGPYIASMNAIDTQSGTQFLAKNKNTIWAAYQSANRGVPVSR
jgi:lambda family phage tail tape measure protein